MHNLQNTKHTRIDFGNAEPTATAWDVTDDSLIVAFGPTHTSPAITLKRLPNEARNSSDAISIASWDAPSPNPDLTVDSILDLHYFPDTKSVTLVLAGGDIVVVREEPQPGEDQIEIVGSVDAGITAAAWSPDEELLAILSSAETLLFTTRAFESVANVQLSSDDVKVSNHVSVGWGKKETQFKGRGAAKALRDPTVPEHVDEGTINSQDDGRATISWRGDGQYLAVNSLLDVEPNRRIIRVFSRDGALDSVSEPVNGLEGSLSWKPSGQIIAAVRRGPEDIDVVFFERNGLRHGEFSLRMDPDEFTALGGNIDLHWNVDSTILAVQMKDRVQLWTMSNYHYYLKQVIRFHNETNTRNAVLWHPEKPLHLCCTNASNARSLSYKFQVCRGSLTPPNDHGIVAVIDGKMLKVTPLRIANVPPPMAFDEVQLPNFALDVAINETGDELAVLHDNSISLFKCDYASKPAKRASLKLAVDLSLDSVHTRRNSDTSPQDDWLSIPETQHLYVRTDHDRIFYHHQKHSMPSSSLEPESLATGDFDSSKAVWRADDGNEVSFQLSNNGVLHVHSVHQQIRLSNCTSFIVTLSQLIFTTSRHVVKFVSLDNDELDILGDGAEKDERCRNIERGAKIVTVIPSTYSLVLQMPRGNLEIIYPRALVLAGIRQSVRNRDYKKAFLTCRTHRVDMNILHDYMPTQFMSDVGLFLKQVRKTEYIDLFLSSLSEENVSETMYRETLARNEQPVVNGAPNGDLLSHLPHIESKVNRICDAFLGAMQIDSSSRLQNIVTAHVCKNPPDLKAGLTLVSDLRTRGDDGRLEEAVEHICFLADVNQLYDTALGLYDLEVALLVAQQAQKDPREYLPYLESLHEMQALRMRFTIDDNLKRYSKAILHLHSLQTFDELKTYMQKHELYAVAIELYRYDNTRLDELMRLHADFLSSHNRFKDAGIAYEYVSDYSAACKAYRAANMWQECLSTASSIPLPAMELTALASDLANSLEESKEYKNAATIHLEYLNDLESAARLLCKGYLFSDAIRLVTLRQPSDLLQSVVDPGLVEASASMTELLSEMRSQLQAQVPRLREIRQRKVDDPLAYLDGADGGDVDIPDNLSLAPTDASTTGGTFMTRYTNRSDGTLATNATRKTSKNKRREERKRARGKKGTVYEAEYLENSIARLIERLNDVARDVAELVRCLMRRGMRERAVAVQTSMNETHRLCKECIQEVFESKLGDVDIKQRHHAEDVEDKRPWGAQGVLWDALKTAKREAPVLQQLEILPLLHPN